MRRNFGGNIFQKIILYYFYALRALIFSIFFIIFKFFQFFFAQNVKIFQYIFCDHFLYLRLNIRL